MTTLFNTFKEHNQPIANRTPGLEAVGLQLLREEDETGEDMVIDVGVDEWTHLRKKKRQQHQKGGGVNGCEDAFAESDERVMESYVHSRCIVE